jgi:hypothetical protein
MSSSQDYFLSLIRENSINEIKRLMSIDDFDIAFKRNTAFIEACFLGNIEIVTLLLNDKRVNPADHYCDALKEASSEGNNDIVQLLLNDPRIDPRAEESEAFRKTIENCHFDTFMLFVNDGRADFTAEENFAITMSSYKNQTKFVKVLWKCKEVKNSLSNHSPTLYNILSQEEMNNKLSAFQ